MISMSQIDMSGIVEDMYVNVIANSLATIFRLKHGYIFINLQGINLDKLDSAIHLLLDSDFNVQTKKRNNGLEIMVSPKQSK